MARILNRLLLKVILERAIEFEEKAYRFYESLLSIEAVSSARELLQKLMAGELQHRMKLEEAQLRGDASKMKLEKPVELENVEELTVQWPGIHAGSSKEDILAIALKKEKDAHSLYQKLENKSHLKGIKELFGLLARQEAQHMQWIRSEMNKHS
jgi:rubrerythrin